MLSVTGIQKSEKSDTSSKVKGEIMSQTKAEQIYFLLHAITDGLTIDSIGLQQVMLIDFNRFKPYVCLSEKSKGEALERQNGYATVQVNSYVQIRFRMQPRETFFHLVGVFEDGFTSQVTDEDYRIIEDYLYNKVFKHQDDLKNDSAALFWLSFPSLNGYPEREKEQDKLIAAMIREMGYDLPSFLTT